MKRIIYCISFFVLINAVLAKDVPTDSLFDIVAIRDLPSLETKVIHDWKPAAKDSAIRQKLVCFWPMN
ncbi:MAG: hypothetical protein O3C43_21050 [Verrucomicrobia bacterium]|nr:hypothetical protein [Verrucomicrobiota bacterium]MDA1068981.1 hypothetical protein [Verrucomicrobiota bacterium]